MSKKSFISLFSGAGGLDRGLIEAGFRSLLSVEIDDDARATLLENNPELKTSQPSDIHAISPEDLLKQSGVLKGELDLLAGGPPCQPFSKSGYWVTGDTERLSDPRAKTLKAYLNIVEASLPKSILLENVKGINYSNKNEALTLLLEELERINTENGTKYAPVVLTVNSADYGVPQLRERVFILANRDGKKFDLPEPTHSLDPDHKKKQKPYTTAWDSIGDLDFSIWNSNLSLSGKWAELVPSIPEGQNYLWHTDRLGGMPIFGWRSRYWSFLLKLSKQKPSWTIQAQPGPATGPFHWKSRLLSTRELARLQTFPDDYSFIGGRRAAHKQIGNAVPPAIGELFGLEIRRQFFDEKVRKKLRLIPERREACPPEEHISPVPEKYIESMGVIAPHPGTGKGPGAIKRAGKQK
ncbi:DNA cytosine methyltransferase [Shewanella insulae]|uniref:DNA cytosine methyltransferase n=1 Tax=Shewanella insulae TaxID=2681496 RepID=UPI001EFEC6F7|nr:DNA cytosine methyltransferase [Shewanella insulae]MCG9737181.1 DNA cytosine methyltransferase [Shewanella insulae]